MPKGDYYSKETASINGIYTDNPRYNSGRIPSKSNSRL